MPYRFIADHLLNIVNYYKFQPSKSLYYNLPGNDDFTETNQKISELLTIFKDLLIQNEFGLVREDGTDEPDCDGQLVQNFGRQISLLFKYNDPKNGYLIFETSWQQLIETLFDVYKESIQNDARKVISMFRVDYRSILAGLNKSNTSNFNKDQQMSFDRLILQKLIDTTRFLNKTWRDVDEKSRQSKKNLSCLSLYDDFTKDFIEYIRYLIFKFFGSG